MNWKLFFKGLGNAVSNGAVAATATVGYQWAQGASAGMPPAVSGKAVGYMALGGGVLGLLNYLMKSPTQTTPPVEK